MTVRFIAPIVALSFISLTTNAQDNNPLIVSGQLLEKASNLYDSGQYKKAIGVYQQIDRNDTNYVQALYGISICYFADSDFNASADIAKKALTVDSNSNYLPGLFDQIGSSLNGQGNGEEAIRFYDSAIAKYPYYTRFYQNKGLALIKLKRFAEAEAVLKRALIINPFFYDCHYDLAYCAINQGKLVPAVLGFVGYLVLNPEGRYSSSCINWLARIAHNTDTVQGFINQRKIDPDESYQLLEQIIQSKIALDKNYKPLLTLDDPISRQIQVLFEKMEYQPADTDFYMQYYIPWFKAAFTNNEFEPFINRLFSGVNVPVIQDYVKKHKKEVDAIRDQSSDYLHLVRTTQELIYTKRDPDTVGWLVDNEGIAGHGIYDTKGDKLIGPWVLVFPAGNIKGSGTYNSQGKREGDFTWYWFSGRVRGKEFYRNGKQEGEETYYFSNGQRSSHSWYRNGELEGESIAYFWTGAPNTITQYHAGKVDGIKITLYANGDTSLIEHYSGGVLNGETRSYSNQNTLEYIGSYQNGDLDGIYQRYYSNGRLNDSGLYKAGKQEGEWKFWYPNGRLRNVNHFLHNKENGERIQYYDNGVISETYTTVDGKITGDDRLYDDDGKLYAVQTYSNGLLQSARYFDKTGKKISESISDHKTIVLAQYLADGSKHADMPFDTKGNLTGTATFYYENGRLLETDVYRDGTEQGPSISWYLNGKKRSSTPYTDGKMDGYHQAWFPNGRIHEEGWYRAGNAQGYWLYHDEQGALTDSIYYLDDDLEGYKTTLYPNGKRSYEIKYHAGWMEEWIDYDTAGRELTHQYFPAGTGKLRLIYANGQAEQETEYLHSKIAGTQREWYFDGKLMLVAHYTGGMQDSIYTSWYHNGNISTRGAYAFGEKTGLWKSYYNNGKLLETSEYKQGDLDGPDTYYYENGKVKYTATYSSGKKEGAASIYDIDGTLAYRTMYHNDEPVSYTYLDSRDSLVPAIPLPLHSGTVKAFFPNGKVSATFSLVDGYTNGEIRVYYPNGQLRYVSHKEYGNQEGEYLEYYPNGKLRETANYQQDNLHGPYREYNDKGFLTQEATYYNGEPEGITRLFDDSGKPSETDCYFYGTLLSVKK